MVFRVSLIAILLAISILPSAAQHSEYQLPEPLILEDGRRVSDKQMWQDERRPELMELFREHIYGRVPQAARLAKMGNVVVLETDIDAFDGWATRRTVSIPYDDQPGAPTFEATLYLPAHSANPVPVFLGVHLFDRRAAEPVLAADWAKNVEMRRMRIIANLIREPERRDRMLAELADEVARVDTAGLPGTDVATEILRRGFGFATIDANLIAPDDKTRFAEGVISYFGSGEGSGRSPDEWGALAAWGWGLSRVLDYFETDPAIDSERVIAIGHSRCGKTALWAAARDHRFAMAISNNSGCGGAALSRRRHGETVNIINTNFPHWFCENFRKFNDREDALPVDQHELIALIAPRPVYVASAKADDWADPRGEFLSAYHASPVYELFGKPGLVSIEMPAVNTSVGKTIGYHIRSGTHDLTDLDWTLYLDFADTLR